MGVSYSVNASGPSHATQLDGTRLEAAVPASRRWIPDRPGEIEGDQPRGEMLGNPGPDAGYALSLIEDVWPRLGVADHESRRDVEAALSVTAQRRASLASRGPILEDVEWAAIYWGMLPGVGPVGEQSPSGRSPADRARLFGGCSHEFELQREIAAHADPGLLALTAADLATEATRRATSRAATATSDGVAFDVTGGSEVVGPPVRLLDDNGG